MNINTYTKQQEADWVVPWIELDHAGNIGIEHIINPILYREIESIIKQNKVPTCLYDFGCGTGTLGRDLCIRDHVLIPGLKNISNDNVSEMRSFVKKYIGYEKQKDLVRKGNSLFKHYLCYPDMEIIRKDLSKTRVRKIDSHSTDCMNICTSRNFLMHLNDEQLSYHMKNVHSILGDSGYYITALLNPEYEQLKHNEILVESTWYEYQHGSQGEYGFFKQWFRNIQTYEYIFEQDFVVKNKIACYPQDDTFINSHPRYYIPGVPMAYVYILSKK